MKPGFSTIFSSSPVRQVEAVDVVQLGVVLVEADEEVSGKRLSSRPPGPARRRTG